MKAGNPQKQQQHVQKPSRHDWFQRIPKQKSQILAIIYQILKGWGLFNYFHIFITQRIDLYLGSEDIRANEGREDFRTPYTIYDEPSTAAGRITVPGYRYLPVHRETYGYSPRNIYSRPSQRPRKSIKFTKISQT